MWEAVVEHKTFSFFPSANLVFDPYAAGISGRDHEAEVESKKTFVWSAMFRNVLAGRQYGKHSRLHSRYTAQQPCGLRAAQAIPSRLVPINVKHEGLPF